MNYIFRILANRKWYCQLNTNKLFSRGNKRCMDAVVIFYNDFVYFSSHIIKPCLIWDLKKPGNFQFVFLLFFLFYFDRIRMSEIFHSEKLSELCDSPDWPVCWVASPDVTDHSLCGPVCRHWQLPIQLPISGAMSKPRTWSPSHGRLMLAARGMQQEELYAGRQKASFAVPNAGAVVIVAGLVTLVRLCRVYSFPV